MNGLTAKDYDLILESLKYTKERFREYSGYPSEEFRRNQIEHVDSVIRKIRQRKAQGDLATHDGTQ
jgi:hypothetical protein